MRIPIPIAIASCFIATGSVWYLSTRDADFITPPTSEQKTLITEQWNQKNTDLPTSTPLSADLKNKKTTDPQPTQEKPPTPDPKPAHLPVGDLEQSPQLAEYGSLGDQGTEAMILLATELENKNSPHRALLAWERVLDTTQPTEEEVSQASQAIQRLSIELPPWNPDSENDITITLHAGTTIKDKKALEEALNATADIISEASGYILKVETQISIGKGKVPETQNIPIAIWFTRPAEKSDGTDLETPPLSFMADPSQAEMLTSQCLAGVYALLRDHLTKTTNYSDLPEYPAGVKPDELLKYHVTRLMWREFANSLK